MRVYLSKGNARVPNWGIFETKPKLRNALRNLDKNIEFVQTGKSDYIIIPDNAYVPSADALATGGSVMKATRFVAMLTNESHSASPFRPDSSLSKQRKTSKIRTSKRHFSTRRR